MTIQLNTLYTWHRPGLRIQATLAKIFGRVKFMRVIEQFSLFGDSDASISLEVPKPKIIPEERLTGAHMWFSQLHEYWLDWYWLKHLEQKINPSADELAEILAWRKDFAERGDGSALCKGGIWPTNSNLQDWSTRWSDTWPGDPYTDAQAQELDRLVHLYFPGGYDAFLESRW